MKDSNDQDKTVPESTLTKPFPLIAGALICVLVGAFMAWGVHALWQLDDIPVTSTLQEQMMHRKTQTMGQILDGLVRGDLSRVEASAGRMWEIGHTLNWYLSIPLYEHNDEAFRDSTSALFDAAQRRDHDAAKESALRLERSCIECHALINRKELPTQ